MQRRRAHPDPLLSYNSDDETVVDDTPTSSPSPPLRKKVCTLLQRVREAEPACIICHDEFLVGQEYFFCLGNLRRCQAKYHTVCLLQMFLANNNSGEFPRPLKCALCRHQFNLVLE